MHCAPVGHINADDIDLTLRLIMRVVVLSDDGN